MKKSNKFFKHMKKALFGTLITVMLFAFSGCNEADIKINTEQDSDTYVENEDYQYFLNLYSNFAKTDKGYYFIQNNLLYFFDKDNNELTLVCSKINCAHNDEHCTAYFSVFSFFPIQLSYYDNALYLLGWEQDGANIHKNYIYQISLDNFKRKKVVYIGNSNGLSNTVFIIHRGYVYYFSGTNTMRENTAVLYRKQLGNLNEKAEGETVFEYAGIGAAIQDISAYGNHIFVSAADYANESGDGYRTSFNSVDIHTLQSKQILENNLFAAYTDSDFIYYEKDENTVARIDLKTGNEYPFCEIDGPCYISADNNYIYFDNLQAVYIDKTDEKNRKITVCDKNGNYVAEVIPQEPKDECYFGGDDYMFFKDMSKNEVYAFDKSQLATQNRQFIHL